MEIKAIKFRRDGFYTQPFVMGGEKQQTGDGTTGTEQSDEFDPNIRYRGSLQNYLIDTGSEVILREFDEFKTKTVMILRAHFIYRNCLMSPAPSCSPEGENVISPARSTSSCPVCCGITVTGTACFINTFYRKILLTYFFILGRRKRLLW